MAETNETENDTQIETVVDTRYRLIREIARGGAGTVFEAKHEFTGRPVALKLLRTEHARDAEQQVRFLREAQALYLARHPNVIEVLDAGFTRGGQVYLVTELFEGRSLSGLLAARGRLDVVDTIGIAKQVASALGSAHARGLVHRDVKPGNVIIRRDMRGVGWRVKLLDFGAAKLASSDQKLTQSGQVLGTPEYMAPEQLMGEAVDHRADIYGLGVTVYECLTGRVPFPGNFGQVLLAVSSSQYPPLAELVPEVPESLALAVARALAPKLADRYSDVKSFALDLQGAIKHTSRALLPEPTAASPEKRRAFARASYVTPVRLLLQGGMHCDGRTEDISAGGLLVLLEHELNAGERVRLRFALPISGKVVDAEARAQWVRGQPGRRVTGLEFMELPQSARETIARYVQLMASPA